MHMRWIRPALLAVALTLAHQPGAQAVPLAPGKVFLPAVIGQREWPSAAPCKLPEVANHGTIGLGFPRYSDRLPAIGTLRARVLLVDFSDAPADRTPAQMFALINSGASQFFASVSYGRLNLVLEPHLVWLRMSKPSTSYGWNALTAELHQAYIQEAVNLANASVDFATADTVIVLATPNASALFNGPAFTSAPIWGGYSADGKTFYNGVTSGADLLVWGARWLNHEMGHTLGLPDYYAYSGALHRFVGGWDLMGLISGRGQEPFAYDRWLLGWLTDTQMLCQQAGVETVALNAIEQTGGVKAVMVPTGPSTLVVAESRRALNYDAGLEKTGVLVYRVDSSIPTGQGSVTVLPDIGDKYQAPLGAGEAITVGRVSIRVVSANATGDTVRVTVAP
jgi:M6 family metalloprotease-like protein